MRLLAFLFHRLMLSDPERSNESPPVIWCSTISPLLRWSLFEWSWSSRFTCGETNSSKHHQILQYSNQCYHRECLAARFPPTPLTEQHLMSWKDSDLKFKLWKPKWLSQAPNHTWRAETGSLGAFHTADMRPDCPWKKEIGRRDTPRRSRAIPAVASTSSCPVSTSSPSSPSRPAANIPNWERRFRCYSKW